MIHPQMTQINADEIFYFFLFCVGSNIFKLNTKSKNIQKLSAVICVICG